jgi:hypothetical protein
LECASSACAFTDNISQGGSRAAALQNSARILDVF